MGGLLAFLLLAVPVLVWPSASPAQPSASASRQSAGLIGLYQRWQQTGDAEERITVGEQLLALAPTVAAWPLAQSRASIEAEIRFGVGSAYAVRLAGVRAENLEKAMK